MIQHAESFHDLEVNKDYIVELTDKKGLHHIRLVHKTEYVCLVEFTEPNTGEITKQWYRTSRFDTYSPDEPALDNVVDELIGYSRDRKIDDLLDDEKKES